MLPLLTILGRAVVAACFGVTLLAVSAAAAGDCRAPEPVCDARGAVFAISAFDPIGSAVRIDDDLLVASRHVIADHATALVTTPDGAVIDADVVASGRAADLALLRAEGLGPGPILRSAPGRPGETVYAIGVDIGDRRIRTYAPGPIVALPAAGFPFARLHHRAYSQPGNSGGALVDEDGRLVGIVASGGEGRNEAIPVAAVDRLREGSGPDQNEAHQALGRAYRACFELLDPRIGRPGELDDETVAAIVDRCGATNNRQNLELAGQVLGQGRRLDESIAVLEKAVALDPNAVNSRLSLVVSLHFALRYADELPHLRTLMATLPDDPQVLRFGIQAGKWAGDTDLAEEAYGLLKTHHPQLAPPARRFLDSDAPAPGNTSQ